jgi:hypothetical protein
MLQVQKKLRDMANAEAPSPSPPEIANQRGPETNRVTFSTWEKTVAWIKADLNQAEVPLLPCTPKRHTRPIFLDTLLP